MAHPHRFAARLMFFTVLFMAAGAAQAEVRTRTIDYNDGDVELQGYFAWDDAMEGKRPCVLIIHAWWGLGEDEKARARQLAEMGYAAFALDMYGTGRHTNDPAEAGEWAAPFYQDRALARSRASIGLIPLWAQPEADRTRTAAIGYCFGGTVALELAWTGNDVRGVVSFHGNPLPALEGDADRTRSRLLICHGAADTLVPDETIEAFTKSLEGSIVDWQLIVYSGAKHSFTTRSADAVGIPGVGYQADADRRSWGHMQLFFEEIFTSAPAAESPAPER